MKIAKSQVVKICQKLKKDFISYSFLSRGAHNESFLIKTKQDKLVLRIENNLQYENLEKEYKFLKKTKGKLGPKAFIFDKSKSIFSKDFIVEEFLEGNPPMEITNDFIVAMAKWLKALHRIKSKDIPEFAKADNYYSLQKSFDNQGLDLYKKFRNALSEPLRSRLEKACNKISLLVKNNEKIFSKLKYFPLNHGDLSIENIFYGQGKIRLIDWEFVKYDLAEWDLASFIFFFELGKKQEDLFLKIYGYGKDKSDQRKLNLIFLLHIFWMMGWWIERLNLAHKKKIDKKTHHSTKKELLNEISKNLPKIEYLIKISK